MATKPPAMSTIGTAASVKGTSTPRRPWYEMSRMSPPPKLWTAMTLPTVGAGLVAHGKPDQVGVVELALLAVVRQRRAVDEEFGAGQRLGGVAISQRS